MQRTYRLYHSSCNLFVDTILKGGELYMVFSGIPGLAKTLFCLNEGDEQIIFINAPFKGAIKISSFKGDSKQYYSAVDKIKMLVANALQAYNILVVETTGLATDSIENLAVFCYEKVQLSKSATIILWQPEFSSVTYPLFQIEPVDQSILTQFKPWFSSIGVRKAPSRI